MIYERILAAIMLASLTFGAGLQVNRTHLVEIFKNAGLLVRVLIANFLIVPAVGYGLAQLFRLPVEVETGFLLMVIAPGVPFVLASGAKTRRPARAGGGTGARAPAAVDTHHPDHRSAGAPGGGLGAHSARGSFW